jgi:hypothetical protein
LNKFAQPRPCAGPDAAARRLLEIAHAVEPLQDGRIYIEQTNAPMLYKHKAMPAEYKAGLDLPIRSGWRCCMRAVPLYASHRLARICSHKNALSNL